MRPRRPAPAGARAGNRSRRRCPGAPLRAEAAEVLVHVAGAQGANVLVARERAILPGTEGMPRPRFPLRERRRAVPLADGTPDQFGAGGTGRARHVVEEREVVLTQVDLRAHHSTHST